jgi:rhomboid protease GluP
MSKKKPVLTIAMLAVLAVVFGVELLSAPTESFATPSIGTLVALGGLRGSLVSAHGEWWRLFTATLLHAGPLHLLLNGVALLLAGYVLESLLGRAWLAALFVIGALGGSLAGLLFNAPEIVSVGASGAIMGLLAAAIVASFRLPPRDRARVLSPLLQFLIPSLLPIAFERSGGHIDFAAHFGGAVAGAVVGLLLMRTWPRSSPAPRGKKLALAGAAVGGLAYAAAVVLMVGAYERWSGAATVALLPNEELRTIEQADPDALAAKYPRDPRVRWVRAMHAADRRDLPAAERELRAAIEDPAIFAIYFEGTKLEPEIRGALAHVLEAEGRHDEALEIARPACGSGVEGIVPFCP